MSRAAAAMLRPALWGQTSSTRRSGAGGLMGGSGAGRLGRLAALGLAGPGLGASWTASQGLPNGGVAQVQVAEALHGHVVEQGGGRDVDALGDLGAVMAQQLGAEQPPRLPVAGDAQLVGAQIVGLVVELDRADRHWVEAGAAVSRSRGRCGPRPARRPSPPGCRMQVSLASSNAAG